MCADISVRAWSHFSSMFIQFIDRGGVDTGDSKYHSIFYTSRSKCVSIILLGSVAGQTYSDPVVFINVVMDDSKANIAGKEGGGGRE